MTLRLLFGLAFAIWTLSGCSPFGGKDEPKELTPADSISRQIAESLPVDTLKLDWRSEGGEGSYFSSIVIGSDSSLWLGDLGQQNIRRFSFDGTEQEPLAGFTYPYVIGSVAVGIAVYDVGRNQIVDVRDPSSGTELPPAGEAETTLSRQAAMLDSVVYFKEARLPQALVYSLSQTGTAEIVHRLPGPVWHHFGVLRTWGDQLVSASSYRPVIHLLSPEGRVDSLFLVGFDSPMLARSRAYGLGTIDEPPLMISGLYALEDHLYVLNVRPGILRIDIFDRSGRIVKTLQREEPEPTAYTAIDLSIQLRGDSTRAYVASVNTVYGSLSLQYISRIEAFTFKSLDR